MLALLMAVFTNSTFVYGEKTRLPSDQFKKEKGKEEKAFYFKVLRRDNFLKSVISDQKKKKLS